MTDKRMLIVDADVARRIDENRCDMSLTEFLNFLIDSRLKEEADRQNYTEDYVRKEEFDRFAQGMKELLRNFLEFFISYALELGDKPEDKVLLELSQKLEALNSATSSSKKV